MKFATVFAATVRTTMVANKALKPEGAC